MPTNTPAGATAVAPTPLHALWRNKRLLVLLAAIAALASLLTLALQPEPVVDLGKDNHRDDSGLFASWDKGELVVLVRHAERCDRSSNPCLGDDEGITIAGSEAADDVGDAFKALGLSNSDIFSSPLLRTVQTAASMFDINIATQDWLKGCRKSLEQNMLNHKQARRNLLLVTHSGCIDSVAKALNTSGAEYDSEYTSALFVSVDKSNGRPRLLGYIKADGLERFVDGSKS
jgi:phosphohistidine phosphatase SixA